MDELYKIQNVTYNATGGTLKNDKAVIDLTAQQNRLLRYLVLNAGQTLTKEQITAHVWGYDVDSDVSNLIYDTVSAVRRLLKKSGLNGAVTTKTGIGYAFTESVEKIKPTAAKTEETCESLPPVFAESAPKFTLDTVYLLLMGDIFVHLPLTKRPQSVVWRRRYKRTAPRLKAGFSKRQRLARA